MGYPHITDLSLSLSFNNAKPSPLIPNLLPFFNHGDFVNNANERSQQSSGSSRWNPTPEQLMTLEELYRRGTRTPSTAQIQQIAALLQRFGKIEGKNVFYWFQNHKARERQKRRRQLNKTPDEQQHCDADGLEKKESAASSLGRCEIEPTNNQASPSNVCKLSEGFISTHGTAKSGRNKWMQIHDKELCLELSCSGTTSSDTGNLCPLKPHQENNITHEEDNRQDQTLELFPLGTGINISNKDTHQQVPITAITTTTTTRYFEFLPLKN
ncbi:Detected protein of unknown function [Hibiscus syriacus]|uniref:Homeobox domain-containing protein n=1 Tax=Hibiscus syriacus TaxID=106335 RepID=A0A6A3A781_HIBSY|nr:Detected protein of unknown function [Hibiscus syriacus]